MLIKFYREQARLSQYELGKKIGVSKKTVYKWETGQAKPSMAHLSKREELFGASLSEGYRDVMEDEELPPDVVPEAAPEVRKTCLLRRLRAEADFLHDRVLQVSTMLAEAEAYPI